MIRIEGIPVVAARLAMLRRRNLLRLVVSVVGDRRSTPAKGHSRSTHSSTAK